MLDIIQAKHLAIVKQQELPDTVRDQATDYRGYSKTESLV